MAQYQRFLSYLFEYDKDQKKENCGFAKVEVRGDVQRIYLSVKSNEQAEILHVFGFYRKGTGCGCVPLGRMVVKNGRGQLQYVNNGNYLAGSSIRFDQLCGLVAGRQQPFSNAYATVWDDQYFGLSLLLDDQEEKEGQELADIQPVQPVAEKTSDEQAEAEKIIDDQTVDMLTEEEKAADEAVKKDDTQPEKENGEGQGNEELSCEELQTLEVCREASVEACESDDLKQDKAAKVWEQLSAAYPHIETLPGDKMVCLKAMPADIGRLPRQNWMLSSNGFLMYSFVKHRYIVFAKVTDGRYELWVPGNYEKSEELMAQMFGFYRFRSVKSQKAGNGDFGYWCVPLAFPTEA